MIIKRKMAAKAALITGPVLIALSVLALAGHITVNVPTPILGCAVLAGIYVVVLAVIELRGT